MGLQVSVSNQAYIFFCSILGGMLIAFIFDLFRIKRKAVETGNLLTYIEDLLYWIIAALVMFAVVYLANEGELRGYIFLGFVMGAALYILLLSRLVIKITLKILRLGYKILKLLWTILSYPFKFLFKVLSIPAIFVLNFIRKLLIRANRIGKVNSARLSVRRRLFRNARKKI